MLVQPTPVSSLSADAKARLIAAAPSLLWTNEAATGFVKFDGKTLAVSEVQNLIGSRRQQLNEGV